MSALRWVYVARVLSNVRGHCPSVLGAEHDKEQDAQAELDDLMAAAPEGAHGIVDKWRVSS